MGRYKVSYKILKQQGEDIKAVAKLVDGYAEKVTQVSGKLGDDALLAGVRKNLSQLREQLVESRTVLNTAGEFLISSVDGYSDVEVRQVKKVDGTKAHNRDFYKNPVVVASAGGAAGGAVAAGVVSALTSGAASAVVPEASPATVNYTDNSVNITYAQTDEAAAGMPAAQAIPAAQPGVSNTVDAQPISAVQPASPASVGGAGVPDAAKGMSTAAKVAIGAAGAGAVAAGGIIGGHKLKKRREAQNAGEDADDSAEENGYDPEKELAKALERVRELEN